jgi:hypothetical protein
MSDQPWLNEKDEYFGEIGGYSYYIRRGPVGALCGYIGVPKGHPWFEVDYSALDSVDVHGGLTFSGKLTQVDQLLWWLGFDCAHSYDVWPVSYRLTAFPGATYKTVDFVVRQLSKLAEQAAEAVLKPPATI